MSDTPRTDAVCGWPWGHHAGIESGDLMHWSPDGPFVHSVVARQLERENAALRKAKEMLEVERCECLRTMDLALNESAGLRGALEESQEYGRNHANAVIKLLSVISRIRRAVDEQPNKSQAMRLEDVGDLCDEALGRKSAP